MLRKTLPLLLALVATSIAAAAPRPRLVVQIVVGSMRATDPDRYAENLSEGGIRRLMQGGTRYTAARYDCQQTTTPVSLTTLSTGAMPSTHGVVGDRWADYTSNRIVVLTDGRRGPGAYHLFAPTLAETMRHHLPGSRTVTVAAEPTSAITMAGHGGDVFWLDPATCGWTTSPYYAVLLPAWVERINREHYNLSYIAPEWRTLHERSRYLNDRYHDVVLTGRRREKEERGEQRLDLADSYDRLRYTPAGNTAVLGLAKQAIAQYGLGADPTPDLLNICLDASRLIAEAYGPESIEVEDALYRLDRDLEDFLTFLFAQVEDAVVVFTSDHGTSPSYDAGSEELDRFRARQFEVIVNGFLNVRYGTGDWVLTYANQSLWLNHNLIYERGLDLADVQNEVAIFAMQFDGISHALSATAMRSSYFGSGYARRMQNSFYPRRSGDVAINFMPGRIEERDRCWSMAGSMYGYDTEVPLVFFGRGIAPEEVDRPVEMTAVASALTYLLGIPEPAASEGSVPAELTRRGESR